MHEYKHEALQDLTKYFDLTCSTGAQAQASPGARLMTVLSLNLYALAH